MEKEQPCISEGKKKMSKFVGEEAVDKKIRVYDEGRVVLMKGSQISIYVFKPDDNGRPEILHLKDQMMELGIVEKEEDIDGKRIRVYDEGVVFLFREKLGMHYVNLDDGRFRAMVLEDKNIEWENEWHLTKSKSDHQLPAVKRIPVINDHGRREWERSLNDIKESLLLARIEKETSLNNIN